jgi:hypothetical protein
VKNVVELTEDDIVNYVCHKAKFMGGTEPYMIEWKCGAFAAQNPRALVLQICKAEGIRVN